MTTKFDILDAKEKYTDHVGSHRCTYKPCDIKLALWRKWMQTANDWGLDPGDDAKQRRQFFERYPNALRQASYRKAA